MAGTTSCIIPVLRAPLCFGEFSKGGVQFGAKKGVGVQQRATLFRTKLTPRLKLSKVTRLGITSSANSTKSSKSPTKGKFIKNNGNHLLEGPIESGHHLLEGPIQTDVLKQLELESGVLKQIELEQLMLEVAKDQKVNTSAKRRSLHSIISARFCDAIEKALMRAFYGSSKPTNYYQLGNYAPVEEFGPQRVLSIRGYLPDCLNGEFLRIGPNPRYKPLAKYHWFDGDGMLHRVRIRDGKVTYSSRYVRTARFHQEEIWGGPKFFLIGDLIGAQGLAFLALFQLRVALGVLDLTNGFGTANTALTYHNGKLLALSESDKPYLVHMHDDGDLETIGRYDYDQKLNHEFTAHPKIDPVTGEMFVFGWLVDGIPSVTYRVVSKDGVLGDPVSVTPSGPIMMHDFAITENYAIFIDCPIYFSPLDMVRKNQDPFAFDGTKPTRFGALPRYAKDESQIRWFDFSTCVIFHNANAWEEGDEVVVVACRSPTLDLETISVYDKGKADAFVHDLWEYRINMKTGESMERKLGEFKSDFPRINEEYLGRKSRYVYTAILGDATHTIGIAKYDLTLEPELGKETLEVGGNVAGVFWFGDQRFGSEPVFVSRKPGREVDEDDGYLLCSLFDEKTLKSEVVVIDAKTMSTEPAAVIELPTRVPYGFHATFVNEHLKLHNFVVLVDVSNGHHMSTVIISLVRCDYSFGAGGKSVH